MNPANLLTKRHWIVELARKKPGEVLFSLHHVIDFEWMREAYWLTRKDGATGIDGVTSADYEANLEANLRDLLARIKSGRYKAPPVRRTYIPKADGSQRPLGIPTFEDKVAQRAIAMVLEAIYEQDFLSCSFGFRPGRSAHQALHELRSAIMGGQRWVLDVDIRKYFDSIPHQELRAILDQRVKDGVIRRMIGKWLKAGVLEDGLLHLATEGTPQGGVISPILSNIFLHHVLDVWFENKVRPCLRGKATLVRFADDFVMTFETHHDAQRVLEVLGKRLGRYGLTLHPDKTRFIDFRPQRRGGTHADCKDPPFDFLGFTHTWGKSRNGKNVVRQTTAKSRLARALVAVKDWCRTNRHLPILDQLARLSAKLVGHFAYYGITGNSRRLQQ
jgi:group II intron reverse transcriptase/maturase